MSRRPKNRGSKSRPNGHGPAKRPQRGASFGIGAGGNAPAEGSFPLELVAEVRRALASTNPFDLLVYASTTVAALEAAAQGPGLGIPNTDAVTLSDFIGMLRAVGERETDGLLLALIELQGDELFSRRVRAEVEERHHRHPAWLSRLPEIRPTRAYRLSHVLGDGENLLVGVDLPSGELTLVIYVDHNMGAVVKDAFPVNRPLGDVVVRLADLGDDVERGELSTQEISLADARAKLDDAIRFGRMTYPPFETDTWPSSRALVEWMLRLMPAGGTGYEVEELEQSDIDDLVHRFSASPQAALDRGNPDDLDIAETLLWFAAHQLGGDPLRWSPVSVEITLLDLVPRKIVADARYLRRIPDVLRRLISFAHAERTIPGHLTEATLAAVDEFELEYLDAISSPHRQGAEALLERLGALSPLDEDLPFADELSWEQSDIEYFGRVLAGAVGGMEVLESLDDDPLPDEPLALHAVPADTRERVQTIGDLISDAAGGLFSSDPPFALELRTAAWRVLARIAASDPALVRRRSSDAGAAAAVLWIAGNVNDAFHAGRGGVTVTALMAQLGLTGSPSQRAQPMLRALGVAIPEDWSMVRALGDPALLTSQRRRTLRERWEEVRDGF